MEAELEVIDAFVDGERVDSAALRQALAAPAGREYLVDALILREGATAGGDAALAGPPPRDSSVPPPGRRLWAGLVAAASVAACAAIGGYAAGVRQSASAPEAPVTLDRAAAGAGDPATAPVPPSPTRVIRLEPGLDWQETSGGNRVVRAALVTALLVAGPVDGRPPRSAGAPTAPEAPSQSGSASSGAATGQTTPQRREQLEQLAKSLMTAAMVARTATRLTVAAPLLAPNGDAAGVAAFVSNDTFAYFVHAGSDLCGQVTFDESEPVTAGSGWRISGEILESSAEQLTARIDWQRLWERGQRLADGPRGSTRLTLRRNDRVPLDYIAAAGATKQCDRVGLGLDITAERHAVFNTTRSVTDAEFDAELWLLRNRDGQQPAVLYQRVRTRSGGAGFVFRPARDAADQSPYAVEITGRIQSARQSDGTPGMFVGLERLFRNLSPEGTSPRGGSGRTIALPAPDDVISFDLPSSSASPGTGGGGGVGVAGARAGGGGGGMLGGQGGAGTGGAAGGGRGRPAPDQRAGAVTSAPPPTLSLRMRLVPAGRLPGTDNPGS